MKKISFLLLIFFSHPAFSQEGSNNRHKIYIDIGYVGGGTNLGLAGGAYGALGFHFRSIGKASCIDIRAKELYISTPEREAGAITLMYRVFIAKGFYVGLGFAHHHETPGDKFVEEPVGAVLGNSHHIIHRTGLAAETGYEFKPFPRNKYLGVYPVINACVDYMVMDNEPNPLFTLSVGFKFGFKNVFSPVK